MTLSNAAKAGTALFVGAVQFGIALILAEVHYPNYNASSNYISDLGATCITPTSGPTSCTIYQPTSMIFDFSITLMGILILIGTLYLYRAFHMRPFSVIVALAGIGAMGVGLFPETTGVFHSIFSLVVFLFAGLSAIIAYGVVKSPFSYFSGLLGLVTLAALVLYVGNIYLGLGPGGMERIIVYPVLLWAVGFGGYLMNVQDWPQPL